MNYRSQTGKASAKETIWSGIIMLGFLFPWIFVVVVVGWLITRLPMLFSSTESTTVDPSDAGE